MNETDVRLQDEINKRLTLNLLIQGSAQHAFLTSHHLVRDELNSFDPALLLLYDQLALAGFVQYWCSEFVLWIGWPDRFWRRTGRADHPFHGHPLLARHGLSLALAAKKRAFERCRVKRVSRVPIVFSIEMMARLIRTMWKERKHKPALVELAKRTTQQVWGISYALLDGALTRAVSFGQIRAPSNFRAAMLQTGAAGYGGVLRDEEGSAGFRVIGKGWIWPILSHELVKGTVELICMHGLNELDDDTYQAVVAAADRPEFEPWMLPVGAELWRRLLPLFPRDRPVAELVMYLARLPAAELEQVMLAVLQDNEPARELFAAGR